MSARTVHLERYGRLAAVLAVAAVLRLYDLGAWGLWVDEAATAFFASLRWPELFGPLARIETNPPFYYGLIKAWMALAGGGDTALRLPSAVAGIGTVAAAWVFVRQVFGDRAAFAAGLMVAVSGIHVFESREARAYVFVVLFHALSLIAARALARRLAGTQVSPFWPACALAAAGAASAAMHYTGILVAAAAYGYAFALLLTRRQASWRAAGWIVVSGVLCLLLASPVILLAARLATDSSNSASWMRAVTSLRVPRGLTETLAVNPAEMLSDDVARIGASFAAYGFALALLWVGLRAEGRRDETLALVGLLGCTILLFLLAESLSPVITPRSLAFAIVPILALMAAAIATLPGWKLQAAALAAFALIQGPAIITAMGPPFREDWRAVVATLSHRTAPGDAIVALGALEALPLLRYGDRRHHPDIVLLQPSGTALQAWLAQHIEDASAVPADMLMEAVCTHAGGGGSIWVIMREGSLLAGHVPAMAAALRRAGARPSRTDRLGALALDRWQGFTCAAERSNAPSAPT